MPSVFASSSFDSSEFEVTDEDANSFVDLGTDAASQNKIVASDKAKIPAKYKKYENKSFQVAKGTTISYKPIINTGGNGLVSNLKGATVTGAEINFGDGTKKKGTGLIKHTFTKAGWYLITVNVNGTCTGFDFFGSPTNGQGKIINGTQTYLVYVADKPQLKLSSITAGYTNAKDYKKGNINFLTIKVTNIGSKASKATKLKIWYEAVDKKGNPVFW